MEERCHRFWHRVMLLVLQNRTKAIILYKRTVVAHASDVESVNEAQPELRCRTRVPRGCGVRSHSTLAEPVSSAVRTLAAAAARSPAVSSGPYDECGWLDRFYALREYAPAWNPSTVAAALWVLRQAPLQGWTRSTTVLKRSGASCARAGQAAPVSTPHSPATLPTSRNM